MFFNRFPSGTPQLPAQVGVADEFVKTSKPVLFRLAMKTIYSVLNDGGVNPYR
jgi:hypothetical protein